jgi:hypothetical protein
MLLIAVADTGSSESKQHSVRGGRTIMRDRLRNSAD